MHNLLEIALTFASVRACKCNALEGCEFVCYVAERISARPPAIASTISLGLCAHCTRSYVGLLRTTD
jgi:hypothetical protein